MSHGADCPNCGKVGGYLPEICGCQSRNPLPSGSTEKETIISISTSNLVEAIHFGINHGMSPSDAVSVAMDRIMEKREGKRIEKAPTELRPMIGGVAKDRLFTAIASLSYIAHCRQRYLDEKKSDRLDWGLIWYDVKKAMTALDELRCDLGIKLMGAPETTKDSKTED